MIREGAVGGEGKPGEAFADAVMGGGVGVELVRQRQFGKIGLTVQLAAVELVQIRVVGRPLLHDPG